jgi:intracellular septation protein A
MIDTEGAVLDRWPLDDRLPGRRSARARSRLVGWVSARRRDLVVLAAVVTPVAVVHAWGMTRYPAFFDDEGTYVSQAYAVDKLHVLAPYTYWYDHPPLGWLLLGAWAKVFPVFTPTSFSIAAARTFILVLLVVSTALVYGIARRLGVRRSLSGFATLLFGLSPLAIHYQRMVLLDNIAVAWLLASLFLALTPRRRLTAYAGSAICLAAAGLTKETFLLFVPAVAFVVWTTCPASTRRFAAGVFTALLVCTAGFYPLFAALRGELVHGAHHTSLMDGIRFQLERKGGGSILSGGSGARNLVDSWLDLDPVLLAFSIPLIPVLLIAPRLRPLGIALALPVAIALRPGGYIPAMYVIGVLPFAAIAVAAVADEAARWSRRERGRFVRSGRILGAAAAVALVAAPAAFAAPRWLEADRQMLSTNDVSANERAVEWLAAHANPDSTMLVDDTVWTDLVQRGFPRDRTVWFYKLDLDPAVRMPWWRFDYVVRSNILAGNLYWLPKSRRVFDHSKPVVVFSTKGERIEIRRVVQPQPAVRRYRSQ